MIKIETSIKINRPPGEVFAFISNFEKNPKWQYGMKFAQFTSAPPLRVGSTYDQIARFLGRPVVSSFLVVDYEPGEMVKAKTVQSSFPITFTRIVKPNGQGSLVTAIVEGDATGLYKIAEPLMRRMVKKSIESDYANLKRILEAKD